MANNKTATQKQWSATMKLDFIREIQALPPKEMHQVLEKIDMLVQDPTPDAKVKKQLKYMRGKLYRIRSGNYRIFYTFESPHISLLTLRLRNDDTYDEDLDAEFLGGFDPQFPEYREQSPIDWAKFLQPATQPARELPEVITEELLFNLRVPASYHKRLLQAKTEDELFECSPDVPDEHIVYIHDYLFKRPLYQIVEQPDFVLQQVNDLARYKEGELLGFLLKLSPEQEKYVDWAINASGPTLLKGGPGTGKSTIALYRVRSLVHALRTQGLTDFRILFTTYTNALVRSSQQLLEQLLGADIHYVEVQTADKLVASLLKKIDGFQYTIATNNRLNNIALATLSTLTLGGNMLQQQAQRQSLERLSLDYLIQEVCQVIIARQISSEEAYLAAPRAGRRVRLNALQRQAVWQFYLALTNHLERARVKTWQQVRALAADHAADGKILRHYDAIVIDEAQDLDPSVLRLLVRHCQTPNRLFITADANQSIYGSGFNWADVHQDLRFQGRTGILRTNYRSTYEIGEAARIYLAGGVLDTEPVEHNSYKNNGPLPAIRTVNTPTEEIEMLARFLAGAARELRLGLNSCAVLCPTVRQGHALAEGLAARGLSATFMESKTLDLSQPGLKVLTLSSSKGLEFPVVALAGFSDTGWYTKSANALQDEEREEFLNLDRRTIFVGMTRAMRALLVLVPAETQSPLLTGFARDYWDMET